MNKQNGNIAELVKEHIQVLNPYAEVILLFPEINNTYKDIQIFVLTPEKVDFGVEQQYMDARYKVEFDSKQSMTLYIYSKVDWHNQFSETPIYYQVMTEGVHL